jgi:hypothetical protein
MSIARKLVVIIASILISCLLIMNHIQCHVNFIRLINGGMLTVGNVVHCTEGSEETEYGGYNYIYYEYEFIDIKGIKYYGEIALIDKTFRSIDCDKLPASTIIYYMENNPNINSLQIYIGKSLGEYLSAHWSNLFAILFKFMLYAFLVFMGMRWLLKPRKVS